MTKVTLVAKTDGKSPWHHARGASPTTTGCGIEFPRGTWHVVPGVERYELDHANRPVCGHCLDWSFLVPVEGQTNDLTERDRVHMVWRPDVATDDTGAWRVRTDDYGWWLDRRPGGCRAWGVARQLRKAEATGLMQQIAKKLPTALDYRDSNAHDSSVGGTDSTRQTNPGNAESPAQGHPAHASTTTDTKETSMALNTQSAKISGLTGLNHDALAQAEGHDGIDMGGMVLKRTTVEWPGLTADKAAAVVRTAMAILPGAAQQHPRASLHAVIRKLDKIASTEATGATDSRESTEEEQDMAKATNKTGSRSRAADTKTRSRSGSKAASSRKATSAAPMETAAAKADMKQLQGDLEKKIKQSVRGVSLKAAPSGSYTTVSVAKKPIAYINPRAKSIVLHLGLVKKPEGVNLEFKPWANSRERFALQAAVSTPEQVEEALKAIEAAAVAVAK